MTEIPNYCTIEKSIIIDETPSVIGVNDDSINYTSIDYSNLSFHYTYIYNNDIRFYSSNNSIISVTTNLSGFLKSEFIQISSDLNNGLFRINDSISPTNNQIIIAPESTLVSNVSSYGYIIANNINSSNIITSNLAIYNIKNEPLTLANTIYNNNTFYKTSNASVSAYSLAFSFPSFTNETPLICTIKRQIISNIINYSDLSFHRVSINDNNNFNISDITFYSSNNSITSVTTDLSVFLKSEFIQINSSLNNGLYRVNDSISPTTNKLIIAPEYTLVSNASIYTYMSTNNINSSNVITSNLAVYGDVDQILISNTLYNNSYFNINNINGKSASSIRIQNVALYNETPAICTIGEFTYQTNNSISFNNNQIYLNNNLIDLSNFRVGQTLAITGTTYNNGTVNISNSIIPSNKCCCSCLFITILKTNL